MNKNQKTDDDDERPIMLFEPGYYYVGIWSFRIPEELSRFGKGGDYIFMLSRKDSEPMNWKLVFRSRHYRDDKAFDSDDVKKSWRMDLVGLDNDGAIRRLKKALEMMTQVALTDLEFFEINGDHEKAMHLLTTAPPSWMHFQMQRDA